MRLAILILGRLTCLHGEEALADLFEEYLVILNHIVPNLASF
jgi:hypothetical protein